MAGHGLLYKCPFCGTAHEVEPHREGEVINCINPTCGKPFQLELPAAQPEMGNGQIPSLIVPSSEAAPGAPTGGGAPASSGGSPPAPQEEEEHTVAVARPAMFRRFPLRFLALVVSAAIGIWFLSRPMLYGWNEYWFAGVVGILFGGYGLVNLFYWWLRVRATSLTITNRRVLVSKGLINREGIEIDNNDLNFLQVHQNWLQRMLGVGDLDIHVKGENTREVCVMAIPDPVGLANTIRAQFPGAEQEQAAQNAQNANQAGG